MSKVVGFVLIVAGLGVGVFAIPPSVDNGRQPEAARSLISSPVGSEVMLKHEVVLVPRSPVDEASRISSPFVAVTLEPLIGKPRIPQERPPIPKEPGALTRALQKELRRVGCYEGDISGTWSQSTRHAMKTFIERMNARLPIEEPGAVLYSLVKSQDQRVCGVACSHGEVQSANGRCIPSIPLAHVEDKAAQSATAAVEKPAMACVDGSVSTTPQSTEPSLEGRMNGVSWPARTNVRNYGAQNDPAHPHVFGSAADSSSAGSMAIVIGSDSVRLGTNVSAVRPAFECKYQI